MLRITSTTSASSQGIVSTPRSAATSMVVLAANNPPLISIQLKTCNILQKFYPSAVTVMQILHRSCMAIGLDYCVKHGNNMSLQGRYPYARSHKASSSKRRLLRRDERSSQ